MGANKVEKNNNRQYFLPRVKITVYNVLLDDRSFYDQPISDQTKKYNKLIKEKQEKGMTTRLTVC